MTGPVVSLQALPRLRLSILILAAGASSRMRGTDKLLEAVNGMPLLRQVALAALGTGLPVVVTVAQGQPARRDILQGLAVDTVMVSGEISASLRAGLAEIDPGRDVLVLLADMPEIGCQDLCTMIKAYSVAPDFIYRATDENGTAGHPVIFPVWVRADVLALQGDTGAKTVLETYADRIRHVALPGQRATTDLDTPEDWARWRNAQSLNHRT
ncbi:NTP transferase domain-containing protein [Pseudorhodobacter sp. W20_MBD10_FR17]|uniref:nucleotidyltransferase family protein n=1 Tax=Pseudorhodobacter sp. W20_MBD10_FR17 TaxID=3240266 RepID=UPI003F96DEBC